MDKNCAIARDLMPQVIDSVASDESRAFVEEHVAACDPCTQIYADMRDEILAAEGGTDREVTFQAAMSQLKKTLGWKHIRTTVIAVLATAVVFILGYTGYYFLYQRTDLRVLPNSDYTVHLFQSESGNVYLIPEYLKRYSGSGVQMSFEPDSGILYVYWRSSIIPHGSGTNILWYPNYLMSMILKDDNTLITRDGAIVREIRQGTENNYAVIYQSGDTIAPLDPPMDAYVQQQELLYQQLDAAYAAMKEANLQSYEAEMEYQDFLLQWESEQRTPPSAAPAP